MGLVEKQSIQDIADAIRNRNGLTTLYKPREMDEAIRNLYSTTKVNTMLDYILPCHEEESTDFTIKYADSDRPASITELEGNTTQNGTPTPSSPVEIKTVSGDNEVLVRGKNLCGDVLRQGVTAYNTGVWNASNFRITSTNWTVGIKAGTYTIKAKTSTTKELQISMVTFDSEGNFYNINNVSGQWKFLPLTFTTPVDMQLKWNIKYYNDSNITPSEVSELQLEKRKYCYNLRALYW